MHKLNLLGAASTAFVMFAVAMQAQPTVTTIVNDTFSSSADRQTGTLSTDRANWFVLSNNALTQGQTSASGGSNGTPLSVVTSAISGSSNAYMARWTPTSLQVGQTLTVSLSLSFTRLPATGTTGLRLGVFNSTPNGVIAGDNASLNVASFTGDTGYSWMGNGSLNIGAAPTGGVFNLGERTTLTAGNLFSTGNDFSNFGTANGTNAAWAINTPYTFTMSFNLVSASELDINESLSGGSFGAGVFATQAVDTTPSATSFDYMMLRFATASAQDITMNGLNVTLSSPTMVPEPATYAALVGLGALGLALWRRKRA